MTVYAYIAQVLQTDASDLSIAVWYGFTNAGVPISGQVNVIVASPNAGQAMRFNNMVKTGLSSLLNTQYGLTTQTTDIFLLTGSSNLIQVPINFGFIPRVEDTTVTATQSASWVTAQSLVTCQVQADSSGDHDQEDAVIEGLTARAINVVPGVSFDVEVYAPSGSWGRYTVNCVGH